MNLVPLHIDKDTGRIVARNTAITSNSDITQAFSFEQSTPSLIWTINHNKGTRRFMIQVYESDYSEVIMPDNIEIVNGNQVKIYFSSLQAGHAHCIYFGESAIL